MKNAILLLTVLIGVTAFARPQPSRGPIGSGGPIQQVVNVSKSAALPDLPGARQSCLDGSSRDAKQLLRHANREAKALCGSQRVDWYVPGYSVGDRQDGVPSFECILDLTAYCHVNL